MKTRKLAYLAFLLICVLQAHAWQEECDVGPSLVQRHASKHSRGQRATSKANVTTRAESDELTSEADLRNLLDDPVLFEETEWKNVPRLLWCWSGIFGLAILCKVIEFFKPSSNAAGGGHYQAISGYRFLCCLIVTFEHMGFFKVGPGGMTFIVLSGCVLSLSRRASPGQLKEEFSLRGALKFTVNRVVRLMPLFWFALLVCDKDIHFDKFDVEVASEGPVGFFKGLILKIPRTFQEDWKQILQIERVHSSHFWFVRTISVLYLAYPLLELLIFGVRGIASNRWILTLACLCCVYRLGYQSFERITCGEGCQNEIGFSTGWQYSSPLYRVPDFLLGMLLPHIELKKTMAANVWIPLAADVLIPVFLLLVTSTVTNAIGYTAAGLVVFSVTPPVQAFCIWSVAFGPSETFWSRVLKHPAVVWAGELSYGVYVWNVPILVFIQCYDGPGISAIGCKATVPLALANTLGSLALSLLLSWSTKLVIEDTATRLLKI